MKKEDFHHEKPRYYATDFPEIMEKIPEEKRNLYPKYEMLHNGSVRKLLLMTTQQTASPAQEIQSCPTIPETQSCPTIQKAQKSNP